jgi:hypothetical protein
VPSRVCDGVEAEGDESERDGPEQERASRCMLKLREGTIETDRALGRIVNRRFDQPVADVAVG